MGELGEYLSQRIYGGYLSKAGIKSNGIANSLMESIQVKVRTLPPRVETIFHFHDFNFDYALCLRFSALDDALEWAREISAAELMQIAVPDKLGYRVQTKIPQNADMDVTHGFLGEIRSSS